MMQPLDLVERIYNHVEARDVDKAVIACLRLARAVNDTFNAVMFLRELHPDVPQLKLAIIEETQHLPEKRTKQLCDVTLEIWIQERTMSQSFDENKERSLFGLGVGDLCRDEKLTEQSIEDLRRPLMTALIRRL
jgi:hypothetical protein